MAEELPDVRVARVRGQLDAATVVGLSAGFLALASAVVLGGSPASFVNAPSVLIVVGGTLCITMACFSAPEMLKTARVVMKTVFQTVRDPSEAAIQVLQIAELARRKGILALQHDLPAWQDEPFLHKGMSMVVDGAPGEEVEATMRRDLAATQQRHAQSTSVLRRMAEFSPAMGLIGTLVGLVQMLGNLDDPSRIGPSMAVALLTTFYGAVLANMVFMPLAAKLERNSEGEALISSVYMMGAASIGRQENPRRLETALNSILPPAKRVRYFD
jgi:chemotaxis protein MotA